MMEAGIVRDDAHFELVYRFCLEKYKEELDNARTRKVRGRTAVGPVGATVNLFRRALNHLEFSNAENIATRR